MRPQAHLASGLLVWSCGSGRAWEAPVLAVAANLPDFDRNVARALGVKRRDHHRWVSHSFAGWLPPTAAVAYAARDARRRSLVTQAVACVWLHLALDTYADGLAWLWPLSEEKIGLFRKPAWIVDRGWQTPAPLGTNLGRAEAAMWLATAIVLIRGRT